MSGCFDSVGLYRAMDFQDPDTVCEEFLACCPIMVLSMILLDSRARQVTSFLPLACHHLRKLQ